MDGKRSSSFLLLVGGVMLLAFGALTWFFHVETEAYALAKAKEKLQNILLNHKALHAYVEEQQKPVLYRLKEEGKLYEGFFAPQLLSFTYIARNIHQYYGKQRENARLAGQYYKLASDNPRNPVNRADEMESEILRKVNREGLKEFTEVMEDGENAFLYYAIPVGANKESCMRCHGDPADAPAEMVAMYGDRAGFFEETGKIRAIISLKLPMDEELKEGRRVFGYLTSATGGALLLIYAILYLTSRRDRKQRELIHAQNRELQELNATLESRVEEETRRLRENEQLLIQQSKMASMGEMIGAIAHQWRQPLNAIGIRVQDLKDAHEYGELDTAYLDEMVRESMRQVNFMSQTIDDFRNFFRTSREKVSFDPLLAVEEVIKLLEPQFRHHQIRVELEKEGNDCRTLGFPNEFKQVILNLLNNAKDALVASSIPEKWIRISVEENDGRFRMAIKDNGGGIPQTLLEKIFEPYVTTKGEKGTGIGLYMSKTIIEKNMEGVLWAANGEKGACFTIELPAAKPA